MRLNVIRKMLSGLAALFYPELCAACGDELLGDEQVLCTKCIWQLPRTQYHHIPGNRSAQNFIGRVPIERSTSFVYFTKQGMMQQLLHQFKYKGRKEIGILLGRLFAEELKKEGWLNTIDGIIPVPLHRKKQRQRGFNQAFVFAEGISQASAIPLWPGVLVRIRHTDTQTHKTRVERIENVSKAFHLQNGKRLEGKHILLVDDVLTTGATLEACALELMKMRPASISIATLALAID